MGDPSTNPVKRFNDDLWAAVHKGPGTAHWGPTGTTLGDATYKKLAAEFAALTPEQRDEVYQYWGGSAISVGLLPAFEGKKTYQQFVDSMGGG